MMVQGLIQTEAAKTVSHFANGCGLRKNSIRFLSTTVTRKNGLFQKAGKLLQKIRNTSIYKKIDSICCPLNHESFV